MFKRKIYEKLINWKKHSSNDTALLIEGARRIGKSTIVEEFAKKEYKSYILIDFNDASDVVKEAFNNYLNDLNLFYMILSTEYNTILYPHNSLIIFDEVQQFPKARQSIKKLIKDGRYSFIETGSLVSIKENVENITIPSEERSIKMYPMDFEEFCWACGETQLVNYIRTCFNELTPLENDLHKKAMLFFRQYMLVGGMPQSISAFLNDRNFVESDLLKRDIISLYKKDISKANKKYKYNILAIFEQIPAFLSKHEKRVRLSNISSESDYPSYEETFEWLEDSMITNMCFNTTDPNIGLGINEERTFVKCYMGDTGLLVSHAFSENEIIDNELYKQILFNKLSLNEGMLFENAIAQCLVANGYKLYYYTQYDKTKKRNDIEIDFIISNKSKTKYKINPIEVKSSKDYRTTSLLKFKDKYRERIDKLYIIHTKNLIIKDDIICIPSYMTFCL